MANSVQPTFIVLLFASQLIAAPTIEFGSKYVPQHGAIIWELWISCEDESGPVTIELPLALSPASVYFETDLVSGNDSTNGDALGTWYYNETFADSGTLIWNLHADASNVGQLMRENPFTGQETEGLWIDAENQRLFAALGSGENPPDTNSLSPGVQIATLHIAASDGIFSWSNAIVSQNGVDYVLNGQRSSIFEGDMNGDGAFDFGDLEPFGLALVDPEEYAERFPGLDRVARGDLLSDGVLDFGDLGGWPRGFLLGNLLTSSRHHGIDAAVPPVNTTAVPEPATLALCGLALLGMVGLVRRRG